MDERVEEMKMDLATRFHDAVVVARGPIASWTALLYLESLPLKGLVCVDPIPFDAATPTTTEHRGAMTTGSRTARSRLLLDTYSTTSDPIVSQIFHEILSDDARTLQLEPNAVPMLILHSVLAAARGGGGGGGKDTNKKEEDEEDHKYNDDNNRQRRRQCEMVAERHGDPNGPFGEVEIRECSPDDPEFALQMIDEWIETIL